MTDVNGTQIGSYTIEREIGRGGMGVVYRGTDTRLDRAVAVKSLPEHLAGDPERLARFEREAKLLASLNHANIAGVYGLEVHDDVRYLVMEFVEGSSLAHVLENGPLAMDEALRIGAQVAAGVEAAHEAGVIHRDLKPGNIVVTPRGQAKVLDFGLAKEVEGRGSSLDLSTSPTMTQQSGQIPATRIGQVMGTAAYLSPEQARGKQLDKRTDIWSFGCVLYEMLTGASPFAGETATDSFGAILHKDPDWSRLPAGTPPMVALLLKRMLAKDPDRRLRDIGDARVELDEILRDPSASSLSLAGAALSPASSKRGSRLAWGVAGVFALLAIGAGALALLPRGSETAASVRLRIDRGAAGELSSGPGAEFAISPDGSTIVFQGQSETGGAPLLYVRALGQFEATPLSGTANAQQPFFSPDGQWIGFFADGSLKKVAVTGGSPIALCDAGPTARGGSWSDDGMIAFTPTTTSGVWLVSANGGQSRQLTEPDEDRNERSHRWPHFLPGSEGLLITTQVRGGDFDQAAIEVVEVDNGQRTVVHQGGSNAKYTSSGHLVFGRAATLYAGRFDPETYQLITQPSPVLEGVVTEPPNGGAEYAVSDSGTLIFMRGGLLSRESTLEWATREGTRSAIDTNTFQADAASLSPDGTRIALQIYTEGSAFDIWIYEIERSVLSRLTYDDADEMNPIWSPDGQRIVYCGIGDDGDPKVFVQRADGSDQPRQLTFGTDIVDFPTGWSPDGSRVVFMRTMSGGASEWDIWTLAVEEEGAEPELYLSTPFQKRYPTFSPDGRWMAYNSIETGRPEVYIRSFPQSGGRWQVSVDGGTQPVWAPDGSALYFLWEDRVHVAAIGTEGETLRIGRPERLFEYRQPSTWHYPQYALSPDGSRFMLLVADQTSAAMDDSFSMILNWFAELDALDASSR